MLESSMFGVYEEALWDSLRALGTILDGKFATEVPFLSLYQSRLISLLESTI